MHDSQSPTLIIIKFYCNCSLHRNHLGNRIFHHKLIPPASIFVHTEIYFWCPNEAKHFYLFLKLNSTCSFFLFFWESEYSSVHYSGHNLSRPGRHCIGHPFDKCWFADSHERGSKNFLLNIVKNHLYSLDNFLSWINLNIYLNIYVYITLHKFKMLIFCPFSRIRCQTLLYLYYERNKIWFITFLGCEYFPRRWWTIPSWVGESGANGTLFF